MPGSVSCRLMPTHAYVSQAGRSHVRELPKDRAPKVRLLQLNEVNI